MKSVSFDLAMLDHVFLRLNTIGFSSIIIRKDSVGVIRLKFSLNWKIRVNIPFQVDVRSAHKVRESQRVCHSLIH